ncbi:MAG: hypothetical protein MUP61_03290 [Burkholderiales bacterium]|nr:hypothetical protein [Burkholderiales bacterium]MCJ7838227.1 hypothetical protein [Burkholderiales bacterium]
MHKPVIVRSVMDMMDRERKYVLGEVVQITGLMPLLMKPRNRQKWTPDDKRQIIDHLRRLSMVSPYLAVMVMPGSFVVLPALAWWLDRRRQNNLRKNLPPGSSPA